MTPTSAVTARELVVAYLSALAMAVAELRAAFPWIGRVGSPGLLVGRTVDGLYERTRIVEGVGEFSFHGIGCLLERADGALVDFDWDSDGREVFDPYRIRRFGRSLGSVCDESALRDACRELVADEVLLEVDGQRFAIDS